MEWLTTRATVSWNNCTVRCQLICCIVFLYTQQWGGPSRMAVTGKIQNPFEIFVRLGQKNHLWKFWWTCKNVWPVKLFFFDIFIKSSISFDPLVAPECLRWWHEIKTLSLINVPNFKTLPYGSTGYHRLQWQRYNKKG